MSAQILTRSISVLHHIFADGFWCPALEARR